MSSTRRVFLTNSGLALASLGAVTQSPSFLNRVLAQTQGILGLTANRAGDVAFVGTTLTNPGELYVRPFAAAT